MQRFRKDNKDETTTTPPPPATNTMENVAAEHFAMEKVLWIIDDYLPRFEAHTVMTEAMRQVDGVKEIINFGYALCVEFKTKQKAEDALADGKVVISNETENKSFRFVTTNIAATYIQSKRNLRDTQPKNALSIPHT